MTRFFIEASPYGDPMWRGAYPEFTYPNQSKKPPAKPDARVYQAPNLTLPHGMNSQRLGGRLGLLNTLDEQRAKLEASASVVGYDSNRQQAISLLTDHKIRHALDVTNADTAMQERYGANSFGWSLLMAKRLVKAGLIWYRLTLGIMKHGIRMVTHFIASKRNSSHQLTACFVP